MATAEPNDLFAVNRDDITYAVKQEELMAKIQDTDFMLVNRGDITYKISGEDVIDSFIPELFLNSVNLSTTVVRTEDTISVSLDAGGGAPPYTVEFQWVYKDPETSEDVEIVDATEQTFYVVEELVGFQLKCKVEVTDSRGTEVSGESAYTDPVVLKNFPPEIFKVELTKTSAGPERYTNQTFAAAVTLSEDGKPPSVKGIQAYIDGSFSDVYETSQITAYEEIPTFPYRVSTNDPQGIKDLDKLFDYTPGWGDENSNYATIRATYYWQIDFDRPLNLGPKPAEPDPNWGNFYEYSPSLMRYTNRTISANDETTGPNTYRIVKTSEDIGYGKSGLNAGSFGSKTTSIRIQFSESSYSGSLQTQALTYIGADQHRPFGQPIYEGADKSIFYFDTDFMPTLTFADNTNLDKLKYGDVIRQQDGDAVGFVVYVEDNRVIMSRWDIRDGYVRPYPPDYPYPLPYTPITNHSWTTGSRAITPIRAIEADRQYLVFDTEGNVKNLTNTKPEIVYKKAITDPTFDIKFPERLDDGTEPDDVIRGDRVGWELANPGTASVGPSAYVVYGQNKFVAVGTNPPISYSSDGINWTIATLPSIANNHVVYAVAYGNNKFVAHSDNGAALSSNDGINWNASVNALPGNGRFRHGMAYGADKFVTLTESDIPYYSSDGITWEQCRGWEQLPSSGTENLSCIAYGNNMFVALSTQSSVNNGDLAFSVDGVNWDSGNTRFGPSAHWRGIAYGDNKFVAVRNNQTAPIIYSADGMNWSAANTSAGLTSSDWEDVTYGDGIFVAISANGQYRSAWSEDGINWTLTEVPYLKRWMSVTHGNDKFVAVAEDTFDNVMYSFTGTDNPAGGSVFTVEAQAENEAGASPKVTDSLYIEDAATRSIDDLRTLPSSLLSS